MALINCPECGKEVSNKAKSCPNCALPFEELRYSIFPGLIKTIDADVKHSIPTDENPSGAYRFCKVEVFYPNGINRVVDSTIWDKLLEENPQTFVVGGIVSIIFPWGIEGVGVCYIGLPEKREIDISEWDLDNLQEVDIDEMDEGEYGEMDEDEYDEMDEDEYDEMVEEKSQIDGIDKIREMEFFRHFTLKEEFTDLEYITGLLTNTFFNEYQPVYGNREGSEKLISEFYMIHFGGKRINNYKIEKIVDNFFNDLPLLIHCIYLVHIEGDDDLVLLSYMNKDVLHKIIVSVYNVYSPNDKKEFIFNKSIELKILECIE